MSMIKIHITPSTDYSGEQRKLYLPKQNSFWEMSEVQSDHLKDCGSLEIWPLSVSNLNSIRSKVSKVFPVLLQLYTTTQDYPARGIPFYKPGILPKISTLYTNTECGMWVWLNSKPSLQFSMLVLFALFFSDLFSFDPNWGQVNFWLRL